VVNQKYKSYAKINIFLKIVGKKDSFHLLNSRFIKLKSLYDIFTIKPNNTNSFTIDGNFDCSLEQNTIYKTYTKLCQIDKNVEKFYKKYSISVEKNIPSYAGLGGASSNAACFIRITNELCKLNLPLQQMLSIAQNIGCDVPFFVYDYDKANIGGFGEIIESFDEPDMNFEIFTPDIKCSTAKVYQQYDKIAKQNKNSDFKHLFKTYSKDILNNFSIYELNDLYLPATKLYEKLELYKKGWHFSGSGSSVFRQSNNSSFSCETTIF